MKVKTVVLDIVGNALEWLDQYGDEDHMEVCEILTLGEDSPIPVWELNNYGGWDYMLVFEAGIREYVNRLLRELDISDDKVLFPLDITGSLLENRHLSCYIFGDYIRNILRYLSYESDGGRYAVVNIPDFTYINVSSDYVILPAMIKDQKNWSESDMILFHALSCEYFDFNDKQDIFCDIGANIGTTCIYFKKKLDPDIKILAFEPSKENYKMLVANALLNDIDITGHRFVNKGLSDVCTSAYLNYNPTNPGGSFLDSKISENTDKIELITFDDYIKENSIDPGRLKYLWIDVEGHEARFLAGASETLSQIKAPIYMEFIPKFYHDREGEFDLLITELGKHFSSFICAQDPGRGKLPIESLYKERNNLSLQWDLFLLKD